MFLKGLVITLLIINSWADSDLDKLFKDTKVIPDVLTKAPKEKLKIEFENGLVAGDGIEYTPRQTKDEPSLDWSADANKFYTVYMSCPDGPDVKNPIWMEFLHWLVVNVPGKDIDKGEVYCPYLGPAAPKTGGLMRYVFLVYEQPGKLAFDEPIVNNTNLEGHLNFKIEKMADKYQLGPPLAGNVFRGQWDDYVPELHRNMGITVDE